MPAKPKSERKKTKLKRLANAKGNLVRELPAHWPRFATPDYYAWMMARMPKGAIEADWSKHQPHNSYGPIFWYEDKENTCVQCGVQFVFTKEEQQQWYEEYKIPIYAKANRCSKCRAIVRHDKRLQREHMMEMANRVPHPNQAFFKRST